MKRLTARSEAEIGLDGIKQGLDAGLLDRRTHETVRIEAQKQLAGEVTFPPARIGRTQELQPHRPPYCAGTGFGTAGLLNFAASTAVLI